MKKLTSLLCVLIASVGMIYAETTAAGDTVKVGDLYFICNTSKHTAVLTYENKSESNYSSLTAVTIPASFSYKSATYSVIGIGERAFAFANSLTSVTIANTITAISNYAFYGCTSLTSIVIPQKISSIGKYVFYNTAITSVTWNSTRCSVPLPDQYIYPVFLGCEKTLSSITFGNTVSSIPSYIGYNMKKITAVIIPNSVTSIGNNAFSGTGISAITIPNSVTSLGTGVFDGTGLTSITIPSSIKTISFGLFQDCKNLASVTLPNTITKFEGQAFFGCEKLSSITIPDAVTSIDFNCFWGCKSLTTIDIPKNVTELSASAFYYCDNLTAINVNKANTSYSSLDGVLFNKNKTTLFVCPGGKQGMYVIPNSVTSIDYSAFFYCAKLIAVEIPQSITSIQDGAFQACTNLKTIINYATTPQIISEDVFNEVDTNKCAIFVPKQSVELYKNTNVWKAFDIIMPIAAEQNEVASTVHVEPDYTSVTISWPQNSEADSYEITVFDNNNNVVCTLLFNADGELISVTPNASQQRRNAKQTQVSGFIFTIIGLEPGTPYNYSVVAKNSADTPIDTQTGSFTTVDDPSTGLEEQSLHAVQATKSIRNGQLYIQRGDELFNAQGARIK